MYENLWDVARGLEDLIDKYKLVEYQNYGHQRYMGDKHTLLKRIPFVIGRWLRTTSYSSLANGRYKRDWKKFLEGIEEGSSSKIEKALKDVRSLSQEMKREYSRVDALLKIYSKYMAEKASLEEWRTLHNTALKELHRMEKLYPEDSDIKKTLREMLGLSEERIKNTAKTRR